jgi:exodeoxyribonuclease VII small subunit
MSEKKMKLETSMAKLEKIVSELEDGEQSLEVSLKKFEDGLKLGKECREILDRADLRIRKLVDVDEDGKRVEGDFEDE